MAALVAYKGTVNPALALGQAFVRSRLEGKMKDIQENNVEGFHMSGYSGLDLYSVVFPQLCVRYEEVRNLTLNQCLLCKPPRSPELNGKLQQTILTNVFRNTSSANKKNCSYH